MARRRKAKTRTIFRKAKRTYRRAKTGVDLVSAGVYGALRVDLANFIQPVTAAIPGGSAADEIAMLGTNWAIQKFVPNRMVKKAARAGMLIEAAALGSMIRAGTIGSSNNGSSGFNATLG